MAYSAARVRRYPRGEGRWCGEWIGELLGPGNGDRPPDLRAEDRRNVDKSLREAMAGASEMREREMLGLQRRLCLLWVCFSCTVGRRTLSGILYGRVPPN